MDVYGISHVGKIRQLNEDSYYVSNEPVGSYDNLFIIADGMGGHNAGEVASRLAVEYFLNYVSEKNIGDTKDTFIAGVEYANACIYEKAHGQLEYQGMGTTFVACCIKQPENKLYVVNVGDSRLYALSETFDQITVDHSYVEELVRLGNITREESFTHPDKNIITRALGTTQEVAVDQFKMKLDGINKILLCSDGLSNMIDNDQLKSVIASNQSAKEICTTLLDMALKAGGHDNITLILIDLSNQKEVI